ncbi:hypothetical protein D3C87_1899810 [compost metagenome]
MRQSDVEQSGAFVEQDMFEDCRRLIVLRTEPHERVVEATQFSIEKFADACPGKRESRPVGDCRIDDEQMWQKTAQSRRIDLGTQGGRPAAS